ncbi:MAG: GIY-YIG nuclease family protein [Anaerolineales bacterium]
MGITARLNVAPGTYILLLQNPLKNNVQIGRWREIEFEAGYYLYVGSAFGPGGVRARVLRHFRSDKSLRWHIDYLRAVTTPLGVWYTHDVVPHEHAWAGILHSIDDLSPIPGFGCSDCRCKTHLFYTTIEPTPARLFECLMGDDIQAWQVSKLT